MRRLPDRLLEPFLPRLPLPDRRRRRLPLRREERLLAEDIAGLPRRDPRPQEDREPLETLRDLEDPDLDLELDLLELREPLRLLL